MKLLIEIGNSKLKAAVWRPSLDEPLEHLGSFTVKEFCNRPPVAKLEGVTDILYSNVGGRHNIQLIKKLARQLDVRCRHIVTPAKAYGMTNCYRDHHRLGIDRWLALLAAWKDARGAAVVIDIGTAITVDLVDGEGQHLGGWIGPGYRLMNRALTDHTALVRAGGPHGKRLEFGRSTGECVKNGCRAALAGTVMYAIEKSKSQFEPGEQVAVYLTGGGTNHLPPEVVAMGQLRPNLVLEGLILYV